MRLTKPSGRHVDLRDSDFFDGKKELIDQWDSPFGNPGEIIWCKEPFQVVAWDPYQGDVTFKYSDGKNMTTDDIEANLAEGYLIECCNDAEKAGRKVNEAENFYLDCQDEDFRIRPAITMPKTACRLWLEVVEVKACRVQELTNNETKAFGHDPMPHRCEQSWPFDSHRDAFKVLWMRQYGPRQLQWDKNPWVWYATVKRIKNR